MRRWLLAAMLLGACAHSGTVYQVARDGRGEYAVAIGERHGGQIWMYDGTIAYVAANQHVRLPSFEDAVLVGDRLYTRGTREIVAPHFARGRELADGAGSRGGR